MPLVSGGENGYRDMFRVGFGMTEGLKIVPVWVSDEALQDREPSVTDGVLAIFDRNRLEIEQIASDKYDTGRIEPDGSVLVTSADLNG